MGNRDYDIFILGSGITGSLAALPLAKLGFKVLVIERDRHPRFVIGESTVPTTTTHITRLGRNYNIPELVHLTRYTEIKKKIPFLGDYPKSHFWFSWNEENQAPLPHHQMMLETEGPPYGPDVHFQRDKVDAYLVSLYKKYGIDFYDKTSLSKYEKHENGYLLTLKHIESKSFSEVNARYIIDASGHSTFFAKELAYLTPPEEMTLKTNTATLYNHFKLDTLGDLDAICGGPCPLFRLKRDAGTIHHCFPGGWIWVIPFDAEYVSVGITMDRNRIIPDMSVDREKFFYDFIAKFPLINQHLGKLKPEGRFILKERTQIQCRHMLGDRITLTPHSAAFLDALFSTGIQQTANYIRNAIPIIAKALKDNNFDPARFQPLEDTYFRDLKHVDTIVATALESFRHPETMKQGFKIWVAAAAIGAVYAHSIRDEGFEPRYSAMFGATREDLVGDAEEIYTLLMNSRNADQLEIAKKMQEKIDKYFPWTNKKTFEYYAKNANSQLPLLLLNRKDLFAIGDSIIRHEYPHMSFSKKIRTLYRFKKRIYFQKLYFLLRKLHLIVYDKYRKSVLEKQKLPWYKSKHLK